MCVICSRPTSSMPKPTLLQTIFNRPSQSYTLPPSISPRRPLFERKNFHSVKNELLRIASENDLPEAPTVRLDTFHLQLFTYSLIHSLWIRIPRRRSSIFHKMIMTMKPPTMTICFIHQIQAPGSPPIVTMNKCTRHTSTPILLTLSQTDTA